MKLLLPTIEPPGSSGLQRGHVSLFISGERFEFWENPERPFGWTTADLRGYAVAGSWELLFNALVLAAAPDE